MLSDAALFCALLVQQWGNTSHVLGSSHLQRGSQMLSGCKVIWGEGRASAVAAESSKDKGGPHGGQMPGWQLLWEDRSCSSEHLTLQCHQQQAPTQHFVRLKCLTEAKAQFEHSPSEIFSKGRNATADLIFTWNEELKNKNSSSQVPSFINLIAFSMWNTVSSKQ